MTMPEEINRLVTDRLSDLLLAPDQLSVENLLKEGKKEEQIRFVGNIMIDTLEDNVARAKDIPLHNILNDKNLIPGQSFDFPISDFSNFGLITLHRPSNVDNKEVLSSLVPFIRTELASKVKLIWPLHPRTLKQLKFFGLWDDVLNSQDIILLNPIDYLEILSINFKAKIVLTDSGGLQEECCITGTPCLTLRQNTERPITLIENGGVSVLVGNDVDSIRREFEIARKRKKRPKRPDLWDGNTAKRCLFEIINFRN